MEFSDFIERLRRGDPEAFTALVSRYAGHVERAARGQFRGKDRSFSEDVAQEVFTNVFHLVDRNELGEFLTESAFRSWLCQVARWRAYDLDRKDRRQPRLLEEADSHAATTGPVASGVEYRELFQRLLDAIANLPERERLVFCACYFDGKSLKQIAADLDTPVGTVKSDAYRARLKLGLALGMPFGPNAGVDNDIGEAPADAPNS